MTIRPFLSQCCFIRARHVSFLSSSNSGNIHLMLLRKKLLHCFNRVELRLIATITFKNFKICQMLCPFISLNPCKQPCETSTTGTWKRLTCFSSPKNPLGTGLLAHTEVDPPPLLCGLVADTGLAITPCLGLLGALSLMPCPPPSCHLEGFPS